MTFYGMQTAQTAQHQSTAGRETEDKSIHLDLKYYRLNLTEIGDGCRFIVTVHWQKTNQPDIHLQKATG